MNRGRDTVKASDKGIEKLEKAYKDLKFRSWEEVAEQTGVHIDTIKRLRGAKDVKNGERASVERSAVEKIAKILNLQPSDIVDKWYPVTIPTEFKTLIEDKTQIFCGRQFVFNAINQFIKDHKSGYFTILGDAGMGKSAIAAKLIKDYRFPCYFNIFADGRNTPEQFLASIRKQLINRYSLQNADNDNLSALIQKVSEKLSQNNDPLIIVIDALDEVKQEGRDNLLSLPQNLPKGVYFLLTRRPYNLETKRLSLSPDTPRDELDLRNDQYTQLSNNDVRKYIPLFIEKDKEYGENLRQWIQSRNINQVHFVDIVAAKSENNFMYLLRNNQLRLLGSNLKCRSQ
jgi:hypothetical protein